MLPMPEWIKQELQSISLVVLIRTLGLYSSYSAFVNLYEQRCSFNWWNLRLIPRSVNDSQRGSVKNIRHAALQ